MSSKLYRKLCWYLLYTVSGKSSGAVHPACRKRSLSVSHYCQSAMLGVVLKLGSECIAAFIDADF